MKFKDIDIDRLMALMKTYGTGEIILKDGKTSIEVRNIPRFQAHGLSHQAPEAELFQPRRLETAADISTTVENDAGQTDLLDMAAEEAAANYKEIKAPLVGTFYRAPAPNEPPFIEVGDQVKSGDTLCIVEAMKNMNEIESEVNGVVREICIQNAEMVEYGQILVKIEEAG